MHADLFMPHGNPKGQVLLSLSLLYRWENWDMDRVRLLHSHMVRIKPSQCGPTWAFFVPLQSSEGLLTGLTWRPWVTWASNNYTVFSHLSFWAEVFAPLPSGGKVNDVGHKDRVILLLRIIGALWPRQCQKDVETTWWIEKPGWPKSYL